VQAPEPELAARDLVVAQAVAVAAPVVQVAVQVVATALQVQDVAPVVVAHAQAQVQPKGSLNLSPDSYREVWVQNKQYVQSPTVGALNIHSEFRKRIL
jgi:hypothetical protein